MSERIDHLGRARELLHRIGRGSVRQRLTRVLVLWDLGYLREALSEFRVSAEEALRRTIIARARPDLRSELLRTLEQGQTTRVVDRLHRGADLLPARLALHLLTLLAWGNYASHAQRHGHQAAAADVAVLLSLSVEIEEWLAVEVEASGSIFDPEDLAARQRRLAEESTAHGLDPRVAAAFLSSAGPGVSATTFRLAASQLGLELLWRRPPPRVAEEPYRGLRAFEPEDASSFHGRDRLLERLEQNVDTRRLTIVSGASGAGKTSLLRAGLIPRLLDLGCGVLLISDYRERVPAAVRAVVDAWPGRPLVLIFDQLERVLGLDAAALRREILELAASGGSRREGLRAVLSLREDQLGRLLREAEPLAGSETLLAADALVTVGPLDREGTREAATLPLRGTGVELAVELVDGGLLDELVQTAGTIPCNLQIVCGRLYREARARQLERIDLATYRELGGARRILGSYLDETLASTHYEGRRELAWSLLRAMTDGEGRRWVELGELWQLGAAAPFEDAVRLQALLTRLVDDRLVVSRSNGLGNAYSLVHDELARGLAARASPEELERQQAQARLEHALAAGPHGGELLRGRTLQLVERHWNHLRGADRPAARALRARSRRARLVERLGFSLLVTAALVGIGFGLLQLRRAVMERERAARFAHQGVLLRAQLELDRDPTQALAWLRHLADGESSIGVMTLVEEARRRGVAHVLPSRERVNAVAFSPDGRLIASGGDDSAVRLWDTARHRPARAPLLAHAAPVTALAFAGPVLFSGSLDGGLRRWEQAGDRGSWLRTGLRAPVGALAASPDGELLVSGGRDGSLQVFSVSRRVALSRTDVAHQKAVMAIAFSPAGGLLASGSLDQSVRLWRAGDGGLIPFGPALTHGSEVYALAFAPDGRMLAVAGRAPDVQLYELGEAPTLAARLHSTLGGRVLALAFAPDGRTLATAGTEKVIQLWDVVRREPSPGPPLRGHLGVVAQLAFSPDGGSLASASYDHTVRVWDTRARRGGGLRLTGHHGEVQALAFSPDGAVLFSAGQDGTVRRWSPQTGQLTASPLEHAAPVLSLATSATGLLAWGGADGQIVLWDPRNGPRTLPPCRRAVYALAFDRRGELLAAAGGEGKVRLFDLRRSEAPRELTRAGEGSIFALAFTPDGETLVAAGQERTIHRWRVGSGQQLPGLASRQGEPIYALAVAPDGRTAASASGDATIQLWDLARGQPAGLPLLGHRHWVLGLAFSPDGSTLASGSSDGTVRLWEVARHRALGPPLLGHTDSVNAVAFAPDGRTLASASGDRSIWLWQLGGSGRADLRRLLDQLTNVHVLPDGRVELR